MQICRPVLYRAGAIVYKRHKVSLEVQCEMYSTPEVHRGAFRKDIEISQLTSLSFLVTSLCHGIIYFSEGAVRKKSSQFMWNQTFHSKLMQYGSALSVSTLAS
jgi:hypothetical protein